MNMKSVYLFLYPHKVVFVFYKHVPALQLLFSPVPVFRICPLLCEPFFHFFILVIWSYSPEVLVAFPYTVPTFHVPCILSTCVLIVIFYVPYQFCLLQHVPYMNVFRSRPHLYNILKYTHTSTRILIWPPAAMAGSQGESQTKEVRTRNRWLLLRRHHMDHDEFLSR